MSFSENLEKVKKKKEEIKTRKSWLSTDRENLIDSVITEINEKYHQKEALLDKKLKECNEAIQEHYKLIEKYSIFDEQEISKIFQELITIFEGEDYIRQTNTVCSSQYSYRYNYANIIINKDEANDSLVYSKEDLNILAKQGKALIIKYNSSKKENSSIKFYELNKKGDLKQLFKFGKFKYLKDFIDLVISYRIDNDIENISEDELQLLMKEFISTHISEIEENYIKRSQEERQQMEEIIEDNNQERQKRLTKILKKA